MIGQHIAQYRVTAKLGQGGMGAVYEAEDTKLQRTVALKFLPADAVARREERARFLREARTAASLDHPNICPIYEIGETEDDQLFLVMPRYERHTLRDRIQTGPQSVEAALTLAEPLADALGAAHERGVIHRDIKPANIMFGAGGRPVILDFGLAKFQDSTQLTHAGTMLGTLGYAAPEQLRGQDADARADVWALGVILYEMLTGRLPFRADSPQGIYHLVLEAQPHLEDIHADLRPIVESCLSKDPSHRPANGTALRNALRAVRGGGDATLVLPKRSRPRRAGWPARILAGVAILAVVGLFAQRLLSPSGTRDAVYASIAVLPIEDRSPEEREEYFASGMTDEIATALSQVGGLRVAAPASARAASADEPGVVRAGQRLGVDAVLSGWVSRLEDTVRFNCQVTDTRSGELIWAQSESCAPEEVLALHGRLVLQIAENLGMSLTPGQQRRLGGERVVDREAHEFFLRGSYYMGSFSSGSLDQARDCFERAIQIAPTYAEAYAGLSDYFSLAALSTILSTEQAAPRALAAARRAVELAPELSAGHSALAAALMFFERDLAGAREELERALAINPSDVRAVTWYMVLLTSLQECDAASEWAHRLAELDPLTPASVIQPGWCYLHCGRNAEAIEYHLKVLEPGPRMQPDQAWQLALAYWLDGRPEQAGAWADSVWAVPERHQQAFRLGALGWVCGKLGRMDEAREVLAMFEERRGREYVDPYYLAWVHLGLGEEDRALADLTEAIDQDVASVSLGISWDPIFRLYMEDPRFQELARRSDPLRRSGE